MEHHGETFGEYIQALKILAISAIQHQDEAIRDAFFNGINSNNIQQRLLENGDMTLDLMFCRVHAYESAQKHLENYLSSPFQSQSASATPPQENKESLPLSAAQNANEICYFCGNRHHPTSKCPAHDVDCNKCSKKDQFSKVCKSAKSVNNSTGTMASTIFQPTLASIISGHARHSGLSKSICTISIHNNNVNALIDSGITASFIHPNIIEKFSLPVSNIDAKVKMVSTTLYSQIMGMCNVDIELNGIKYKNIKFKIMHDLCTNVILGLDFQSQHM